MSDAIKHILILSSWYPNRNSPFLGNFVQQQARLLSSKFKVTVLYTVSEESLSEIDLTIQESENLSEIIVYHPKGTNFYKRRREQDKAFETGLKIIDNVDLIHAHVILPKGYLFIKAKKNFDCPLILTEHGSYFRKDYLKKMSLKEKFILKYTKKHIDQLISVSEFLKRDLQKYFGKAKILVIPNPIDTDLFVPVKKDQNEIKQFLHISTLDKTIKNPKGIIESIILLNKKGYSNFKFTIVSDEPYTEWQLLAEENEIESFVQFIGPFKPEELVPLYQKSDAFILFSSYETFSIVLAESWACGIPTISTPVGIAYDLSKEMGIQIKIDDPLSLAMAMEKILNGLTFNADLIRKNAIQYSNKNVFKQLTKLYAKYNG